MKVDVIVGLQWGDEGKGKMIDVLSENYNIVARYQGGPNAGHTIVFQGKKIVLHTLPSGICRDHCINVIGNGVVIDPLTLLKEVSNVSEVLGIERSEIYKRLRISSKSSLILPSHTLIDKYQEDQKGEEKIGSTLKGIGPCYTDKIARNAILTGQVKDKNFYALVQKKVEKHLAQINYTSKLDIEEWHNASEWMKNIPIIDTEIFINQELKKGNRVLAEGAQGAMLDVNFGTYPYVTSSTTMTSGACSGLGIAPQHIGKVYGVVKAYTTRVGAGPFPTEQSNSTGEYLQQKGAEFGATTGRKRRCGWLDLPLLRYAIMLNGVTDLMVMKVDVLAEMQKIKVAKAYVQNHQVHEMISSNMNSLSDTEIIYEDFYSWNKTSFDDVAFARFINYIEQETSTPVSYVSYGPCREEVMKH